MKKFLIITILCGFNVLLFGQSDEILDKLYEEENAQTLYTALIVLQAGGVLDPLSTINDAREYLEHSKWGNAVLKDELYLTFGGFSLLIMEGFNLPHGIMYNFLPIKRYALKELIFKGVILGNPYPGDLISSFDVIYILSTLNIKSGVTDMNKNYVDDSDSFFEEETGKAVEDEVIFEEVIAEELPEETILEEPVLEESTPEEGEVFPVENTLEDLSQEEVISDDIVEESVTVDANTLQEEPATPAEQ